MLFTYTKRQGFIFFFVWRIELMNMIDRVKESAMLKRKTLTLMNGGERV
jgi:hypothetical protein